MMMNEGFGESQESVVMGGQQGARRFAYPQTPWALQAADVETLGVAWPHKGDERAPCRVLKMSEFDRLHGRRLHWRIESCKAKAVPESKNDVRSTMLAFSSLTRAGSPCVGRAADGRQIAGLEQE